MLRHLNTIVIVLSTAGLLHAGPVVRRANSVERVARFEYVVTNTSKSAQSAKVYLPLPQANARQEVLAVVPMPGYENIIEDGYGNRIAVYNDQDMPPGEVRHHGWIAAVRTYAAVWERSTDIAPLSAEDQARYLCDRPNYQITSPVITSLRDSLIRPEMSDVEKVSAVFDYLVANFKYVRDSKWDPAPQVLQRKEGSCSEYTFSFVSLMRASGIPCRYTGGLVLSGERKTRYDEQIIEDAVFHRWAEVYLKDYGWFPVDGSRAGGDTRRFGNYLNNFGRLPSGSLQLYSGDGGDDSYLGWDYTSNIKGAAKGAISTDALCFWSEAPGDKLKAAVDDVEAALAANLPPERLEALLKDRLTREVVLLMADRIDRTRYPNLVEGLLVVRHPSAVYYALTCDRLGVTLPVFLTFPHLVDDELRAEIIKHRAAGAWKWGSLEHWWRKARPQTSYVEPRGLFTLSERNLDLN